MFIPSPSGAAASTASAAPNRLPTNPPPREQIRHMLFGTLSAVQTTIRLLHKLGYAEPNDWSQPIPTGRANEVMAILTRPVITGQS